MENRQIKYGAMQNLRLYQTNLMQKKYVIKQSALRKSEIKQQ